MNTQHTTKMLIIRVASLVITVLNAIVVAFSPTVFADMLWYKIVTLVFLVASAAWNCWENNDFTPAAKLATRVFDKMKDGSLTTDEVRELVNDAEVDTDAED